MNASLLHHEERFLKGTGQVNGFETEVVDTYLHEDVRERIHFEFVNEELWSFLSKRYGFDHTIKRYYQTKGGFYSSCEIDARFPRISVFLAFSNELYAGEITEETFKPKFIQLSAKKSFSDIKKRITDIVTAQLRLENPQAAALKPDAIRLWLATNKEKLLSSF